MRSAHRRTKAFNRRRLMMGSIGNNAIKELRTSSEEDGCYSLIALSTRNVMHHNELRRVSLYVPVAGAGPEPRSRLLPPCEILSFRQ